MPSLIISSLCAAAVSASCYSVTSYIQAKHRAGTEHRAVERVEQANATLRGRIKEIEGQIAEAKLAGELQDQIIQTIRLTAGEFDQETAIYNHGIQFFSWYAEHVDSPESLAAFMTNQHYPEPLKLALLQRIKVESRFRPQATSPSGAYHCLIQWDHTRYRALLAFTHYRPIPDAPCPPALAQMRFMHHEITTNYRVVFRANRSNAYSLVTSRYFGGQM